MIYGAKLDYLTATQRTARLRREIGRYTERRGFSRSFWMARNAESCPSDYTHHVSCIERQWIMHGLDLNKLHFTADKRWVFE